MTAAEGLLSYSCSISRPKLGAKRVGRGVWEDKGGCEVVGETEREGRVVGRGRRGSDGRREGQADTGRGQLAVDPLIQGGAAFTRAEKLRTCVVVGCFA